MEHDDLRLEAEAWLEQADKEDMIELYLEFKELSEYVEGMNEPEQQVTAGYVDVDPEENPNGPPRTPRTWIETHTTPLEPDFEIAPDLEQRLMELYRDGAEDLVNNANPPTWMNYNGQPYIINDNLGDNFYLINNQPFTFGPAPTVPRHNWIVNELPPTELEQINATPLTVVADMETQHEAYNNGGWDGDLTEYPYENHDGHDVILTHTQTDGEDAIFTYVPADGRPLEAIPPAERYMVRLNRYANPYLDLAMNAEAFTTDDEEDADESVG